MNLRAMFTENLPIKLTALLLAVLLHAYVRGEAETETIIGIPVRVVATIPEGHVLTSEPVDKVMVSVGGDRRVLEGLKEQGLDELRVNLSEVRDGLYQFSSETISVPPGLRIHGIHPPSMRVEIDRRVTKVVPVNARLVGEPSEGYRLVSESVSPEEVTLTGPAGVLQSIERISTANVRLAGRTQSFEQKSPVRESGAKGISVDPAMVTVAVTIKERAKQESLLDIPLVVSGATLPYTLETEKVTVLVEGPQSRVADIDRSALRAVVDASALGNEAGKHRLNIEGPKLPDGVSVLRITPPNVLVTLEAPEDNDKAPEDSNP